jgi:hypothetical protein
MLLVVLLVRGTASAGTSPRAADAASATGTMGVTATVVDSCTVNGDHAEVFNLFRSEHR